MNEEREGLTIEQIDTIAKYGDVLSAIHLRLASEGYFLADTKTWDIFKCVTKPSFQFEWEDYN